jgi:hypothetical protein
LNAKRLTLPEMWNLYGTLKNGAGHKEEYLIDEVFELLENITKEDFLQALLLLYPKIEFVKLNPVEMATLFIAGLKKNSFFEFVDVLEGLHGNPKR